MTIDTTHLTNLTHMTNTAPSVTAQSETRTNDPVGNLQVMVLPRGNAVPKPFFDNIMLLVREILPALERDISYTAEMLCGEDFWKSLSAGERRRAGMCLSNMVQDRLLPLVLVHGLHEYPLLYQLA